MFVAKDKEEEKPKEESPFSAIQKEREEYFNKSRKVFLWGGVDDESAEKIIKQMLFLDYQSDEDIYFMINSPGGVISSGLAIYDCMQSIKANVNTVVCGQAASMGAVLLCAGAAGKRYAWQHSRIMIHQPLISGQMFGPASDIEIQAEEMLRIRTELNTILANHSGQTVEKIEQDTDRDNFMSGPEAVKYGLVDKVENLL